MTVVGRYIQVAACAFSCVEYARALALTIYLKYWPNNENFGDMSPAES